MREESVEADGLQHSTQNRPVNKSAPEKISAGAARTIQPCHSTIGLKMQTQLLKVPLYPHRTVITSHYTAASKTEINIQIPHSKPHRSTHTYHERGEHWRKMVFKQHNKISSQESQPRIKPNKSGSDHQHHTTPPSDSIQRDPNCICTTHPYQNSESFATI